MTKHLWKQVRSWASSRDQLVLKPIIEMNKVNTIKENCHKLTYNLQTKLKLKKGIKIDKSAVSITLIPLVITIITGQLVPLCDCNKLHRRTSNDHRSLQEWDDIFNSRTDDDWRMLWHKEKHRRCQHQLVSHMELVCEKDIYKLARKRRKRQVNTQDTEDNNDVETIQAKDYDNILFATFDEANQFGRQHLQRLRSKKNLNAKPIKRSGLTGNRISKRGISDECCHGPDGCSWEEYAEYCPANVRSRMVNN